MIRGFGLTMVELKCVRVVGGWVYDGWREREWLGLYSKVLGESGSVFPRMGVPQPLDLTFLFLFLFCVSWIYADGLSLSIKWISFLTGFMF